MTLLSREEILKVARGSQLETLEHEIDPLIAQIQDVLTYAQRVKTVATDIQESSTKNVNVYRPDAIIACDAETILKRAPEREGDFFVVPMILDNN